MTTLRPTAVSPSNPRLRGGSSSDRGVAVLGVVALGVLALLAAALVAIVLLARTGDLPGSTGVGAAAVGPSVRFAAAQAQPAPRLELTDQEGRPFSLTSLRGRPALVFFGYTHCPDVCPATVGTMGETLAKTGPAARAVFVSIDPDRDDVASMKSYLRYLPAGFVGLSGTPQEIRDAADAWGVQYAKIDTGSAGGYAMAHTADQFLIDGMGRLRGRFPFGTQAAPIAAAVTDLMAELPPPSEAPVANAPSGSASAAPSVSAPSRATPAPVTPAPTRAAPVPLPTPGKNPLYADLVTTSIWAGGPSPIIVTVRDAQGYPLDAKTKLTARLVGADGVAVGKDVDVVAVRPVGDTRDSFVATVQVPTPGDWRLDLRGPKDAFTSVPFTAQDPGSTAAIGAPAPDLGTPTVASVGGNALAVTTVRQPDLRLSQTSTADARAAGKPYVLVIDSERFQTTPACGRAISVVGYLIDRWPDVAFIHLEPFEYSIVTSEPVLNGDIKDPPLNRYARAWGLGVPPWPPTAQPWVFVVDGSGTVRAKYTGIMGSDDVDVILSQIEQEAAAR